MKFTSLSRHIAKVLDNNTPPEDIEVDLMRSYLKLTEADDGSARIFMHTFHNKLKNKIVMSVSMERIVNHRRFVVILDHPNEEPLIVGKWKETELSDA